MKRVIAAALAAGAVTAALAGAGTASANPWGQAGMGCQTDRWGFLGLTQKRTICDTPRYRDGHWDRTRVIWAPAHNVPASSYCGTYSCSFSEGYYVGEQTFAYETYPVHDGDVLPDEPGWLPTGTAILR